MIVLKLDCVVKDKIDFAIIAPSVKGIKKKKANNLEYHQRKSRTAKDLEHYPVTLLTKLAKFDYKI